MPKSLLGDFPGGPVVKTSPFNAEGMGSVQIGELTYHRSKEDGSSFLYL